MSSLPSLRQTEVLAGEAGEARLTAFLVVLSVFLFVLLPVTDSASWQGHAVSVGFTVVLIFGAFAGTRLRRIRYAAAALGAMGVLGTWSLGSGQNPKVLALGLGSTFLFLVLTTWIFLLQVFAPGRITAHRLRGAVAVFLLAGIAWGVAYSFVEAFLPGSSIGVAGLVGEGEKFPSHIYFSFVTLTTLGYGDFSPTGAVMRSLAVAEAIFGQFYLAILVARLVSLEILHRSTEPWGELE